MPAVSHAASDTDTEEVSPWLRRVQPDLHARVYVSLSKDLAIETSWEIFAEYWDDFCYPSWDTSGSSRQRNLAVNLSSL